MKKIPTTCTCDKGLSKCDGDCRYVQKIDFEPDYHRNSKDCTCYACNMAETKKYNRENANRPVW